MKPTYEQLLSTLRQTTFALQTVIHLSGSRLDPKGVAELIKYAEQAEVTIEKANAG